ncbi:MAG: response regulator transcription factor [Planctomycetota bacterium]
MPTLTTQIRVVLADDHEMVREALARILDDSGKVIVVAQACSSEQTIEMVRASQPEVVVLDYSMPSGDASATIGAALRASPGVKVLMLTVHENIHYAIRALEAGAAGYLIKSAAVDELVEGIETVHRGGIYLSPKVSPEVLQHLRQPKRQRVGLASLSQREFDLLRLLGAGKTLSECAAQMDVSSSTASTYRSRIMEKLNLSSTAEMIRFALEHDFLG